MKYLTEVRHVTLVCVSIVTTQCTVYELISLIDEIFKIIQKYATSRAFQDFLQVNYVSPQRDRELLRLPVPGELVREGHLVLHRVRSEVLRVRGRRGELREERAARRGFYHEENESGRRR